MPEYSCSRYPSRPPRRISARRIAISTLAAATFVLGAAEVKAESPADFYEGKSLRLIVSSSPGGGYDAYGRLISRHITKFIPGKPDIVVQNMPGAGGLKAGNYLYNVAPKDGTVFGGVQNGVPFEPLFGRDEAQFDPVKFNWLGSPNSEVGLLLVWHENPVTTLEEAKQTELVMGASGAASTPAFFARILNEVLDTKLKIIPGYPGQTEAFLAMERGEVDGYPSTFWSSLKSRWPEWVKDEKVRILLQYGREPHPELADVPVARKLAPTAADRTLLDLAMAPLVLGRPYVAPPDIPTDRVAALRSAMAATFKSPGFLAEANRLKLEVSETPLTGEDINALLEETYSASPEIVERLIAIYNTSS